MVRSTGVTAWALNAVTKASSFVQPCDLLQVIRLSPAKTPQSGLKDATRSSSALKKPWLFRTAKKTCPWKNGHLSCMPAD